MAGKPGLDWESGVNDWTRVSRRLNADIARLLLRRVGAAVAVLAVLYLVI